MTFRRIALTTALGLSGLQLAHPAQAQESRDSLASLHGQVLSRAMAQPIEQALVLLHRTGRGALTDENGRFRLDDVEPGLDTVEVQYIGFEPSKVAIELEPGKTTDATLLLSRTVVEVAELKVEVKAVARGKLLGFEQRKARGFGIFITPEQIERRNPQYSSDMLRGLAGVAVGAYTLGSAPIYIIRGQTAMGQCEPTIYLDGNRMSSSYKFDDLPPKDLLAIEVYRGPSEMPVQWQQNACGLLVVWTREGPRPQS